VTGIEPATSGVTGRDPLAIVHADEDGTLESHREEFNRGLIERIE